MPKVLHERNALLQELFNKGYSYGKIAEISGVSLTAVYHYFLQRSEKVNSIDTSHRPRKCSVHGCKLRRKKGNYFLCEQHEGQHNDTDYEYRRSSIASNKGAKS